jgi:hypothetical protein
VPALDFIRGDLLDPTAFKVEPDAGEPTIKDAFAEALDAAIKADEDDGLIAVFGTGYPIAQGKTHSPSTGYTGVDNIHMNQGTANRTGQAAHYRENGANQDGALIFLAADGSAKAFFVKFQSQTLDTDAHGNPIASGHATIDRHLAPAMAAVKASPELDAVLAKDPTPHGASTGFVFDDPAEDAVEDFEPDKDTHFNTPYVQTNFAKGQHTEVPTPRDGPLHMSLTDVVGASVPGHTTLGQTETIRFDMIGDSGAVTAGAHVGEMSVGEMMTALAKQGPPAFCYHVGDVVYYYGEKQFYYGQFAEVFKEYPAPIFAIPGNHDAMTYDASQIPLQAFQQAFCAPKPGIWDGFGGVRRTAMTQPGVYFTLDAPLVSIVGLYSNSAESGGWVNDQQLAYLRAELTRLKPMRAAKQRAVILAIHHLPKWFPNNSDSVGAALDAIFKDVGLWPDAVVVGHAHLYQRIVRPAGVGGAPVNIPYFVNGAGGYAIKAAQASGGAYVKQLPTGMATQVNELGFLRVTVTKAGTQMSVQFDYLSAKQGLGAQPADTWKVTL